MKKRVIIFIVIGVIAAIAIALTLVLTLGQTSDIEITSYNWDSYLSQSEAWYKGDEAKAVAKDVLKYQLSDGGWRKDMANEEQTGSWGKSTVDNDATTSQIRFLAKMYKYTGNKKYLNACLKGIDLLINGQYSNGGWPQVFDDAGTYHAHITYNDGAMIHIMDIMRDVSNKSGDFAFIDDEYAAKAQTALEKGIRCILDTQIVVDGVKTAWCQQHDEFTLKPTSGRSYELASISASESVGIVNFLKGLPNKTDEIVQSINSAIEWMTEVQIYGIKVLNLTDDRVVIEDPEAGPLWARFYQIGTNTPIFVDRDGSLHYELAGISQERRAGYAWYGTWPKSLVEAGPIEK